MDLKKVFENRRSVNFFDTNRPLNDDVLKNIINLAVLAPSAFNLQPWEIIAVKSEEAKNKLLPLASNQPKILEAPVTLIIVGHKNGAADTNPVWADMAAMLNDPEAVKNAQGFAQLLYGSTEERKLKFAESNAALLAMSIMYAAQYYGVDSHPMSGMDFDGVARAFNLGPDKTPVMMIALGYYDVSKSLYPRRARLGYDKIVTEI